MSHPPNLLKRFFFAVALGLVVFVLLVAGLSAFENWRGERAWKKYRAQAEARGEKLDLKDFIPPPVPDEENFAAIPALQDAALARKEGRSPSNPFVLPDLPRSGATASSGDAGNAEDDPFDLIPRRDSFIAAGWIDTATDQPARDVLRALERLEPQLQQIRDAASRPKCRFPVEWEKGFYAASSHLGMVQPATLAFALRARAFLVLGDNAAAYRELRFGFRLCDAMKTDPSLIGELVAIALSSIVDDVVQKGLKAHVWTPEELKSLIADYDAKRDGLQHHTFILQCARALENDELERIAKGDRTLVAAFAGDITTSTGVAETLWAEAPFFPRGWLRQSQVKINDAWDAAIARVQAGRGFIEAPPPFKTVQARVDAEMPWPVFYLAREHIPAMDLAESAVLFRLAAMLQTKAACALELFRLRHGAFPETLGEALAEASVPIPIDPCDGHPLRYRKTENGYRLWSVGEDRKDDGGTPGRNRNPRRNADLVWEEAD